MFRNFHHRAGLLVSGILIIVAQATLAHTGASGIVKQRMDAMGSLGDHARIVGDMLKGKTPFEREAVKRAADAFVLHGDAIPSLFPDTEHSRHGATTEALPAIWTRWDEFVALAERFTEDSRALARVAGESAAIEPGDAQLRAVRAAFFKASRSCSACHERFRLDQD